MKRADIERTALDIYARVFVRKWFGDGGHEGAFEDARDAFNIVIEDLEAMMKERNTKQRSERIKGKGELLETTGALELLRAFKEELPRLAQPPTPPPTALMLNLVKAAARNPIDVWRKRFTVVRRSDFLMGKTPGGFQATLPWIIMPSTCANIDAGKYV